MAHGPGPQGDSGVEVGGVSYISCPLQIHKATETYPAPNEKKNLNFNSKPKNPLSN
jgi:hypothetical protein